MREIHIPQAELEWSLEKELDMLIPNYVLKRPVDGANVEPVYERNPSN